MPARAQKKDPIKGTYQHYKGALYEMLGLAEEPQTGKRYIVYQSLGVLQNLLPADPKNNFFPEPGLTSTPTKGELAVCSIEWFTELVDGTEYHPGQQVPRFRLVAPARNG
jgi:hypothetical protein